MPLLAIALVGAPVSWPRALVLGVALVLAILVVAFPSLALWPPGVILLAMAIAFATTLRPGRMPLIEAIARQMEGARGHSLPQGATPWLRGWTQVWAMTLALLGLASLLIAALDATGWWLVWVLGAVPACLALVLVMELVLRRRRFPEHPPWGLVQFLVSVIRVRPGELVR
jgi:uncharacterized membrane protein